MLILSKEIVITIITTTTFITIFKLFLSLWF